MTDKHARLIDEEDYMRTLSLSLSDASPDGGIGSLKYGPVDTNAAQLKSTGGVISVTLARKNGTSLIFLGWRESLYIKYMLRRRRT